MHAIDKPVSKGLGTILPGMLDDFCHSVQTLVEVVHGRTKGQADEGMARRREQVTTVGGAS